MSAKPKPLWWRVGKGKWHIGWQLRVIWMLVALCGADTQVLPRMRRSAPPVAQQCKSCRAAKARQRKEQTT